MTRSWNSSSWATSSPRGQTKIRRAPASTNAAVVGGREPSVAEAGDPPQAGRRAPARDPDRRSRPLPWPRFQLHPEVDQRQVDAILHLVVCGPDVGRYSQPLPGAPRHGRLEPRVAFGSDDYNAVQAFAAGPQPPRRCSGCQGNRQCRRSPRREGLNRVSELPRSALPSPPATAPATARPARQAAESPGRAGPTVPARGSAPGYSRHSSCPPRPSARQ